MKVFYNEHNRLPADILELEQFAAEAGLQFKRKAFKKFVYFQNADSSITIEYELDSPTHPSGGFTIQPEKASPSGEAVDG